MLDRDADGEVGQGSVKSTVFSKGQWLVLYTAHGVEGGGRGLNGVGPLVRHHAVHLVDGGGEGA